VLECSVITWNESNEFSFLEVGVSFLEVGVLLKFIQCPTWVEKTHWVEFVEFSFGGISTWNDECQL